MTRWPWPSARAWCLAGLGLFAEPGLAAAAAAPAVAGSATPAAMSAPVRAHWQWVLRTGDHDGSPFVIIDKRGARLWLFDASARPLAQTPVLLGLARGDASFEGIGGREMSSIRPHERTTPAGRFIAEPGVNAGGEDIFWVDYDAAVSLHRVRATQPAERRLERLASPTAEDNRISYGCINVPASFYDRHVRPTLLAGLAGRGAPARRPVIYLLPETLPHCALFKTVPGRPAHRK